MHKIISQGITFGLAAAVATEFIEQGLEPFAAAQMHVEIENHGPFLTPTAIPWIASGQYAISLSRLKDFGNIAADTRLKVDIY